MITVIFDSARMMAAQCRLIIRAMNNNRYMIEQFESLTEVNDVEHRKMN